MFGLIDGCGERRVAAVVVSRSRCGCTAFVCSSTGGVLDVSMGLYLPAGKCLQYSPGAPGDLGIWQVMAAL